MPHVKRPPIYDAVIFLFYIRKYRGDKDLWGGVYARDAWNGLCLSIGLDPDETFRRMDIEFFAEVKDEYEEYNYDVYRRARRR